MTKHYFGSFTEALEAGRNKTFSQILPYIWYPDNGLSFMHDIVFGISHTETRSKQLGWSET